MTVIAEPDTATETGRAPRCEVVWQCPDQCCPPARCPNRATRRVSFRCATRACDHAGDLLLMCGACVERADQLGDVLARRPL